MHKSQYLYDTMDYKNNRTKISIMCTKHGVFLQTPSNHLAGNGCPKCNSSKGELKILEFLERNFISNARQVKLMGCKNIFSLPFDFGLYHDNQLLGLIEFHGKQHFLPIMYYGGEKAFEKQKKRDIIKIDFCSSNNIPLLVIPYTDYQKIDYLVSKFWKDINNDSRRTLEKRISCSV